MHAAATEQAHATGAQARSAPAAAQRVVFDLPEKAAASERRPFKGWVNRPWAREGRPYDAVAEYRHFLERFPLRALPD